MKPFPIAPLSAAVVAAVFSIACAKSPPPKDASGGGTEGGAPAAPVIDRTQLPQPWAMKAWAPPGVAVPTLSNGMKVYFLRSGLMPLVSIGLVFPSGAGTDPVGREGLTSFTADMLDEGAGSLSALELSEALQRIATDYGSYASTDALVLNMQSLSDAFPESVALLADIARRPKLPRAEFNRRKKQRLAAAEAAEEEPGRVRELLLRQGLFGDGYGGAVPSGIKRTIAAIRYSDIKRQYRKVIQPEGASFVVTGNIDPGLAMAALESAFGDWKGKPTAKPRPLRDNSAKNEIFFVDFPGKPQSAIAVARRAGDAMAPDYFPAMVFNRAFGGAFTSRVNLNLREDKGYTYGARSGFSRGRKTGVFRVWANVKSDTTRASLDEITKELSDLCTRRPLTPAERDDAVGGLLLSFPSRFEDVSGVASQLEDLPINGWQSDWYTQWTERVQAVELNQSDAAARGECDVSDSLIVIAGDWKTVGPTLESLGKPIVTYSREGKRLGIVSPTPPPMAN